MLLEALRDRAIYQNTIDTWIALCGERSREWHDVAAYKEFIAHLLSRGVALKKFPLCIKEAGGEYSRGRDKTSFAEALEAAAEERDGSNLAAAYTVKLGGPTLEAIRAFGGA